MRVPVSDRQATMAVVTSFALLWCCVVQGAEFELAPPEIRIAVGETQAIEFGTLPQRDTTILLEVHSRMDSPGLGGSMFFLQMELNGKAVIPAKSRTLCRLINKPVDSPVTPDLTSPWFGTGGWRVVYAPDFEAAAKQAFYVDSPYRLVLDITDLTNPAAENRLSIKNTATAALAQRLGSTLDLVIGTLRVTTQPGESPMMAAGSGVEHVINRGEPGAGSLAYDGQVQDGGGFTLAIGGRPLGITTDISYPGGGVNRLLPADAPDAEGQGEWQVVAAPADDGGAVTAGGPDYTLRRTVTFTPRRVEIADEITNTHADTDLGLMVSYSVDLGEGGEPTLRLAGNGDPAINDMYAPANPSVHIALDGFGLGMICEDDVFRNQAHQFFDADTMMAGLRTQMLCLGPGQSHTLRWSIYPVGSRDYYDFINLVRADWGSNFTVEGAWCFFSPDSIIDMPMDQLRASLERLGINYACSWGGWVDPKADRKRIGFGAEVLSDYWSDYRRRLKEATARLHEARPGIKVIIYYDSQRDTHENAAELYPDSTLTNAQGQHMSTNWNNVYSLTWSMVATAENSFGKAMLEVVDAYMADIGADGLYWDEMENVAYGYPLLTHNQWDGHSCTLTDDYRIAQKVGITTLLGEGHRLAVIDRVRARGGTLMGNGPPTTRAILDRHVQRMVEVQHNDYWCYQGHLDTPLGYASSQMEFSNITRALAMATLLVGTRLDYEHEISRYLFPITPIELHHGYILGRERLVTMHSGRYGWPGETVECMVHYFGSDGKLRESVKATAGPGDARIDIQLAEGEVAVVERQQ